MRKAAQSMYQPGNRSTVTSKGLGSSKLLGGSAVGGSAVGGNAVGLQGRSMLAARKVEGHDLGRTVKSNFEQTVQNLKSRPSQKVLEDEYINEEIKYLEYELKLLKDKEMLEREGVNELDNFLKDEIPINENILAMKNKYNATKAKLEGQLSSLTLKKGEAEEVLATQKNEIGRLHEIIGAHRRQRNERRAEFKEKLREVVKEITMTADEYAATGEDGRRMQELLKRMNEEISTLQRQAEKEKVGEVRASEERVKRQEKFEERVRAAKEEMVETAQQAEELEELEGRNPLVAPLEEQNSQLRKRIMLNEKQKSTAENNIAEIELFLREEERERELERQHKAKYVAAAEECRLELQTLDREADSILKQKTLRAKKLMLKEGSAELQEKEEVYELLSDRLRNLEQECSNLIQEKKELQEAVEDQKRVEREVGAAVGEAEEAVAQNRSNADSLRRVAQEAGEEAAPVQGELEKGRGRIPLVQRDIERKQAAIGYLNKQLDLLKELKNLDLGHLHMIAQGGSQMQNALHSFIKNWEKIKSL